MSENQKLIVVSGLQGSGKSTLAHQWVSEDPVRRLRINYDDLRLQMFGPNWKWNITDENKMKFAAQLLAEQAIRRGDSVIVDNTNLTRAARKPWMNVAKSYKVEYEQVDIDTPVAECVRRDRLREGNARVGRALIEHNALFYGYIDWSDREVYPRDFIIVDMDGTIADCDWRRKLALEGPTVHRKIPEGDPSPSQMAALMAIPGAKYTATCYNEGLVMDRECPVCGGKAKKNWPLFFKDCEKDPVIEPIVRLVGTLSDDYDVLIVSGRPLDKAGFGTETWLEINLPDYVSSSALRHLFMRNRNDMRSDVIVKQEILDLLPKDRIKYVLDDRQSVVDMWRKNGLTCLQVADGNF